MHYFQIFSDLRILNKPDWFDAFVDGYYVPVVPHITFTQTRRVEEAQAKHIIEKIKIATRTEVESFPVTVVADQMRHDTDEEGVAVLLDIQSELLSSIQRTFLKHIPDDLPLQFPDRKQYEDDFCPHLTIATTIPPHQQKEVFQEFDLENLALELEVASPFAFLSDQFTTDSVNNPDNHIQLLS